MFGFFMKKNIKKYSNLVRYIVEKHGIEEVPKYAFDILKGIEKGDAEDRYKAWKRYLKECQNNEGHTDTMRDGLWVPAIFKK